MTTIFDQFSIDGVDYYKQNNKFYADNMTIRETITLKQYKLAMMQYLASA